MKDIKHSVEINDEEEAVTEKTVMDEEEKEDENIEQSRHQIMRSGSEIRQRQPRNQISSDAQSNECPECKAKYFDRSYMMTHYMKESSILVISVIIELHSRVIFTEISWTYHA